MKKTLLLIVVSLAGLLAAAGASAEASRYDPVQTVRNETEKLKDNEALVICGSLYLAALFADGKIVEEGTHEQLLALDGEYASLYKLQFRAAEEYVI